MLINILLLIIGFTFCNFYDVKTGEKIENPVTIKFMFQGDTLVIKGELRGDFSHSSVKTFDSQRIFNDDYIGFVLSDGTNSYSYIFNPAGTKRDEIVFADDFYTSPQWDGNWDVTSNYSDSLRKFKMKIFNWYVKKFRVQIVVHQAKTNRDYCLSVCKNPVYCYRNFREITFENVKYAWRWQIKPYFAIKKLESVGTSYGADAAVSRGRKIKMGITVNPDYSELESDPEMIDLEDKPIYLPEKRDFFKDDLDLMKFYTRSIRKPLWGVKFVRRSANPSFLTFFLRDSTGINYFYNYFKYRILELNTSLSTMVYDSGKTKSYFLSYSTQINPITNVSLDGGIDLYLKNNRTGVSYNLGFGKYNDINGLNMVITVIGRDSFYTPETELLFLTYIHKTLISLWYKLPVHSYGVSNAEISVVTHNWFDWNFKNKRYNKNTFSVDLSFKNNWNTSFFVVDEWMDWKGALRFVEISTSKVTSGWDVISFSLLNGIIGNEKFLNTTVSFGKSLKFLNFSVDLDDYLFGSERDYIIRFKTELKILKRILVRSFLQSNTFSDKKTLNFLVDYGNTRLRFLSALNQITSSKKKNTIYTFKFEVRL